MFTLEPNDKFMEIWKSYNNQYGGKYESNPPGSKYPTSWTFYSSRGMYGVLPPTAAIIITTVYEAKELSPVYISGISTRNGFCIFNQKRQITS
ncbi:MAG: hypothetical protein LBU85_11975 [Treponema sp.]|jgi:hypothetical protein|nr:hypothetical protein [Treponema sp.]